MRNPCPIGSQSTKLRNYYLLNPLEEASAGFKLLLRQTDKKNLLAILKQKGDPIPRQPRDHDIWHHVMDRFVHALHRRQPRSADHRRLNDDDTRGAMGEGFDEA